jgi:hypothetical protein
MSPPAATVEGAAFLVTDRSVPCGGVAGLAIKVTVLLAGLDRSVSLPAKDALRGYDPSATLGVIEHDAVPAPLVVAMHIWPASEKVIAAPLIGAAGDTEKSISVAVRVIG